VRDPSGWYRAVQDVATRWFREGGITIDTPPDRSDDEEIVARTVVQADGDVLWMIHPDHVDDAPLLDAHLAAVRLEVGRSVATMRTAIRDVGAATTTTTSLLALVATGAGAALDRILLGYALALVPLLLTLPLQWSARAWIRSRLRGAGAIATDR
jgi:hypothetical protein